MQQEEGAPSRKRARGDDDDNPTISEQLVSAVPLLKYGRNVCLAGGSFTLDDVATVKNASNNGELYLFRIRIPRDVAAALGSLTNHQTHFKQCCFEDGAAVAFVDALPLSTTSIHLVLGYVEVEGINGRGISPEAKDALDAAIAAQIRRLPRLSTLCLYYHGPLVTRALKEAAASYDLTFPTSSSENFWVSVGIKQKSNARAQLLAFSFSSSLPPSTPHSQFLRRDGDHAITYRVAGFLGALNFS